jgi:hypothetical protein
MGVLTVLFAFEVCRSRVSLFHPARHSAGNSNVMAEFQSGLERRSRLDPIIAE